MNYSEEQNKIFDYAEHGILNMIVQAVAGAGKTTTLVECANRIKTDKRIMMLAQNGPLILLKCALIDRQKF